MTEELPHLYTDLADWWTLLSAPEDYEEEAGIYERAIHAALPQARTLLELGSGGGNNASHLKQHFEMTLVELSPRMIEMSKKINPELPHMQGDMRTVRLNRTFDAVFVHDAVMYMTSEDDLRKAIQTAAVHTRLGGVCLFVPDMVRETFRPQTIHGGEDDKEGQRALRYLEWSYDPDPSDTTFITDFVYLLRTGQQEVRCVHDRHITGIFPRATWLRLFEEAGFEPEVLVFEHSEVELGQTEMFLGRKK